VWMKCKRIAEHLERLRNGGLVASGPPVQTVDWQESSGTSQAIAGEREVEHGSLQCRVARGSSQINGGHHEDPEKCFPVVRQRRKEMKFALKTDDIGRGWEDALVLGVKKPGAAVEGDGWSELRKMAWEEVYGLT